MTLARLRDVDAGEIAAWLSAHGNFSAAPFKVPRFVMMSSRNSVGGGPYVVEENWKLGAPTSADHMSFAASASEASLIVR